MILLSSLALTVLSDTAQTWHQSLASHETSASVLTELIDRHFVAAIEPDWYEVTLAGYEYLCSVGLKPRSLPFEVLRKVVQNGSRSTA